MHCLVTGASGFIGQALVPELLASGCRVTRVLRQPARGEVIDDSRLTTRCADLVSGVAGLDLEGVDVVFHLAGIAHQQAEASTHARVNYEATLRLAQHALSAGVRRFVYISSVKAASAGRDAQGELLTSIDSAASPYAQSKALAEVELAALCSSSAMQLVILRPALVYGDSARGHLRWLQRWVSLHLPAPPQGGGRSMIAREDLLRLLLTLAALEGESPQRVTVTDGECYSTRRLHRALCAASGRRPWLPSPPAWLWQLACRAFDALRGQTGHSTVQSTWQRLVGEERYPDEGLDQLGFRPRLSFERSLGLAE